MVSKSKATAKKTTAKRKTAAKSKAAPVKVVSKATPKKKTTSKKETPISKKTVVKTKTVTKVTVKKATTVKKKTTTKKQISKKAATAPTKVTIKQPMTNDTQDTDIATLEAHDDAALAIAQVTQAPSAKKAAPSTSASAATLAAKEIIASTKTRNLSNELPDIDPDSNKNLPAASQGFMGIAPYAISPSEEYMNEKQRQHFKNILLAWRLSLMEEVDRIVNHMQDESANFPDPTDRATQEEEFSLALRARDRERKLIRKINEALERIKHDEYGFCDTCGVDIGVRRLEARPTATLCIDCKTLDEIRERQMKQ